MISRVIITYNQEIKKRKDYENMRKVVVTGGTGFIGKHLTKLLSLRKDIEMVLIDNLSNSQFPDFMGTSKGMYDTEYIRTRKLSFYCADIRDGDALDWIFSENSKIDTCIHLAAKVSVTDSFKNQNETCDVNVKGTKNLLTTSAKYGVKNFIFASSAAVYGNSKDLPLKESSKLHPISPYGESKIRGEELVSSFGGEIPNALSLRLFNVYGIGQTTQYAGVITRFADRLISGLPPVIYGTGRQIRDFISVRDVVRAILLASGLRKAPLFSDSSRDSSEEKVYNIGTGIPTRITDLAKVMIGIFTYRHGNDRPKIEPIYTKAVPGDVAQSYADVAKAIHNLGLRYRDNLNTGLRNMYEDSL